MICFELEAPHSATNQGPWGAATSSWRSCNQRLVELDAATPPGGELQPCALRRRSCNPACRSCNRCLGELQGFAIKMRIFAGTGGIFCWNRSNFLLQTCVLLEIPSCPVCFLLELEVFFAGAVVIFCFKHVFYLRFLVAQVCFCWNQRLFLLERV